jgi:hypothetical protein
VAMPRAAAARAIEPRVTTIEGRKVLVVENQSALPRSLADLLREMTPFGFAERDDFTLAGTRPACEVLRVHRWKLFRRGRWSNPRPFSVVIGKSGETLQTETVPRGVRDLRLEMCADCGAVCVRDISTHGWAGAKPARLVNLQTGRERIAPAVGQRDLVIGWYSGKRRAGRQFL